MKLRHLAFALSLSASSIISLAPQAFAETAAHHAPHWSYSGENGPENWGHLSPEFATCSTGTTQSPIDIRDAQEKQQPQVTFQYQDNSMQIVNNGHTIQLSFVNDASNTESISINDKKYQLQQFHFHTPSEERINGKRYDMVAHLVHASADNKLAVVAVLFKVGKENDELAKFFNALPKTEGQNSPISQTINPAQLLPTSHAIYHFMGSLTTPPCTEGVEWLVMKQPVELSATQLQQFKTLFPMNARPTQNTNGRTINEIDD